MFRNRVRNPNAFALLACSALLITSLGCNPGGITAPDSSSTTTVVDTPNFIRILSSSSKGSDGMSMSSAVVSQLISAEHGGVVSNGWVTLVFPPSALNHDTEITIELTDDGTLGAELTPHGIQFNRAVTMTLDLSGTNAEGGAQTGQTLWENKELNRYEVMDHVPSSDGNSLKSQLHHFSRYQGVSG